MDENKGKLIGQGYTAEVYEWGQNKILKLYRLKLPDFLCQSEYTITQKIYNQFGICPKVYDLISIEGRNGIVYEKIDGKTMLQMMLRKLWTIKTQSIMLAHYHLSIQKKINFKLPTVKAKLKKDIERVSELTTDEKDFLNEYIDSLPDGNVLCHFDFHPGNIMMKNHKPIIIDWMTASVGDPLADIARTSILLKYSDIPSKSVLLKKSFRWIKQILYRQYINEYLNLTKSSIKDVDIWELPISAARLSEWIPVDEKNQLMTMVHLEIRKLHKTSII